MLRDAVPLVGYVGTLLTPIHRKFRNKHFPFEAHLNCPRELDHVVSISAFRDAIFFITAVAAVVLSIALPVVEDTVAIHTQHLVFSFAVSRGTVQAFVRAIGTVFLPVTYLTLGKALNASIAGFTSKLVRGARLIPTTSVRVFVRAISTVSFSIALLHMWDATAIFASKFTIRTFTEFAVDFIRAIGAVLVSVTTERHRHTVDITVVRPAGKLVECAAGRPVPADHRVFVRAISAVTVAVALIFP